VTLVKAAGNAIGGLFGKGKDKKNEAAHDEDPAKAAKIAAGLAAIDAADAKHETDGKIEPKDAEIIAKDVQRQHPVFKSITVIDGGETWDYEYLASPGKVKRGAFKGASKDVRAGIARLQVLLDHEKIPYRYRAGIAAQLRRAEELHKAGKLLGVEVTQPGGKGRVDFITGPPRRSAVEYKYWTQEYTDQNVAKLARQLLKYQAGNKQVVLEFGVTKTNPVTVDYVEEVLHAKMYALGLTFDAVRVSEQDRLITVVLMPLE
jgi:hypothetical protein